MRAARPTQAQLRAGESASWGGEGPPRLSMRLLAWKPVTKNSLRGFADVELPNGLRIREVPVLSSHGKCWASLPSMPVLDHDGKHVENGGKKEYARLLEWRSRELADGFSAKVVDLVRQTHPGALEGEAGE